MGVCEFVGSRFAARVIFSTEQDIPGNRTKVRVTRLEMRSVWEIVPSACWVTGTIKVGGSQAVSMILNNTQSCPIRMTNEYSGGGAENWFGGFRSVDVWIDHHSDGSMENLPIAVNLSVYLTNGTGLNPGLSGTQNAALERIPRVSEIRAEPVELGDAMRVELIRAVSGFSDTLRWRCGTASGIIAQDSAESVFTWTPELALAAQAPNAESVDVELTVTTLGGDLVIGEKAVTVRCPIPAGLVPTAAVTVSDKLGYAQRHGGYIQSRSQARVQTQAQGSLGAGVKSIDIRCGRLTGQGEDVSFGLENSGEITVTVRVTDSRGRKATAQRSITVLPYEAPSAVIRQAFRCDGQGTAQDDGAYCKIVFDALVTPVENGTAEYRVVQRLHNGEAGSETLLSDYTGQFTVTGGSVVLPAGLDTGYDCCIRVTDSFGTAQSLTVLVSVAFALLDMNRQAKAVGIGMRAKNAGKLSIGLDTDMNEHGIGNLADPVEGRDAATKAYVDRCIQALEQKLGR